MSTWYERSSAHIQATYDELKRERPDLNGGAILDLITRDYYPFGERKMFPYKAWLRAMTHWRQRLAPESVKLSRHAKARIEANEEAMELFSQQQ